MTTSDSPTHLVPIMSNRGFARLPPIDGINYGAQVRVYESSNAEVAAIWLKAVESPHTRSAADWPGDATVQLTMEAAVKLAEQILWLRDQHHMVVQA